MSRRANPRKIGAFALGALVIVVASIIILGSGRFFETTQRYVLFFDESVKGLTVGAPVDFRGVPVGNVSAIQSVYVVPEQKFLNAVEIELVEGETIDVDVIDDVLVQADYLDDNPDDLIAQGLRGQLSLQSIVTGQLFIALDFFPNTPADVRGDTRDPEIPTIPSPWSTVKQSLDDVMMSGPEILERVDIILASIQELAEGDTLAAFSDALSSLSEIAKMLADPDGSVAMSIDELPQLMENLRMASEVLPELLGGANTNMGILMGNLEETTASLVRTSDQLNNLVSENRPGLKDFTERGLPEIQGLVEDMTRMVNELNGAIRDMRQDPPRFFFGNQTRQGVTAP